MRLVEELPQNTDLLIRLMDALNNNLGILGRLETLSLTRVDLLQKVADDPQEGQTFGKLLTVLERELRRLVEFPIAEAPIGRYVDEATIKKGEEMFICISALDTELRLSMLTEEPTHDQYKSILRRYRETIMRLGDWLQGLRQLRDRVFENLNSPGRESMATVPLSGSAARIPQNSGSAGKRRKGKKKRTSEEKEQIVQKFLDESKSIKITIKLASEKTGLSVGTISTVSAWKSHMNKIILRKSNKSVREKQFSDRDSDNLRSEDDPDEMTDFLDAEEKYLSDLPEYEKLKHRKLSIDDRRVLVRLAADQEQDERTTSRRSRRPRRN